MFRIVCLSALLLLTVPAAAQQTSPGQGAAAQMGAALGTCLAREAEQVAALQKQVADLRAQIDAAKKPAEDAPK